MFWDVHDSDNTLLLSPHEFWEFRRSCFAGGDDLGETCWIWQNWSFCQKRDDRSKLLFVSITNSCFAFQTPPRLRLGHNFCVKFMIHNLSIAVTNNSFIHQHKYRCYKIWIRTANHHLDLSSLKIACKSKGRFSIQYDIHSLVRLGVCRLQH